MKKVLVYFKNKALCSTREEAVQFINSLPSLQCNDHTKRLLDKIFNNENGFNGFPITELATTGIGPNRIRLFEALGDTLEEHQANFNVKMEARKQEQIQEENARTQKRLAELYEAKKGWYSVSLTFERMNQGCRIVESTFSGQVVAQSGADAFDKAQTEILNKYNVFSFPKLTSSCNFEFFFLGVKTDDGYSVQLWEEWKKEGVI